MSCIAKRAAWRIQLTSSTHIGPKYNASFPPSLYIQENAKYVEGGATKDTYASTYSAQYQLVARGGGWKIAGGKVLYK